MSARWWPQPARLEAAALSIGPTTGGTSPGPAPARAPDVPLGPPPITDEEEAFWRAALRWGFTALLGIFFAFLILNWSAIQISDRAHAAAILQEALVPLTAIDDLLDREYESLVAEARRRDVNAVPVHLSGTDGPDGRPLAQYPLVIVIPAEELATMSQADLRRHMLTESAARLYDSGVSAFKVGPDSGPSGGLLSPRGVARLTIGQLTNDSHQLAQITGGLTAFITILLFALVMVFSRDFGRIQNVGLALSLAAIPMTFVMVGSRFTLKIAADGTDDIFDEALLDIGTNVLWIPIRNYIIFAILGVLVLGLGLSVDYWSRRRAPPGRREPIEPERPERVTPFPQRMEEPAPPPQSADGAADRQGG